LPLADTLNVAVPPWHTLVLTGAALMLGALVLIVTEATVEVAALHGLLMTTAR
jgi:hypothetical protein